MRILMIGERMNHDITKDQTARWVNADSLSILLALNMGALQNDHRLKTLGPHDTWMESPDLHTVNLLKPEHCGGWSRSEAKARALSISPQIAHHKYERVILLGRRVATAFGFDVDLFLTRRMLSDLWRSTQKIPCLLMPHPSGKNYWWNDAANVNRARSALREFISRR